MTTTDTPTYENRDFFIPEDQRDEHMPKWATHATPWNLDCDGAKIREVWIGKYPFTISAGQVIEPDGTLVTDPVLPHIEEWIWTEDEKPKDVVNEMLDLSDLLRRLGYTYDEIMTGDKK